MQQPTKLCCILFFFLWTDPPLGRVSFRPLPTASRRADRPSKPDMPTTGIGHSGAQAIVPDRLAALKANAPSPRVYGQPGLTFADARPEWRGYPSRYPQSS